MKEQLYSRLVAFGQEHLLDFWDVLDRPRQESLAGEIRGIDFELVASLYREYRQGGGAEEVRRLAERATAPLAFRLGGRENRVSPDEARARGIEALRAGEVGVCVVAGGKGTRLGFDRPKGMYPIGPVSKRCFFQIHIEKILARSRRHGSRIPLYLMTSPATHAETVEFLSSKDRFGLPEEDLTVFRQGTIPALDEATGKVLLAEPHRVALSPNGHGGMLAAIQECGCLDDMRKRGLRHLFYFQVDNPLVGICCPEFIGYHLLCGSEMSTQVVAKETPFDKVGNVVEVDGRLHVIEYSDLPRRVAERRAADGSLLFSAGSIAVHVMQIAFLERMAATADALRFHFARKKVRSLKPGCNRARPRKRKAVQFERFIFDLLPWAANPIIVEVDAAAYFAPLKNASRRGWMFWLLKSLGRAAERDTPETVRAQMVALYTEWLRRAGAEVADGVAVEIGPLFALDAEELAKKIPPGTQVTESRYFQ